jgi:hypothetical protein
MCFSRCCVSSLSFAIYPLAQDDSLIALTQLNLTTVQRAIAAEFKTDLLCIRSVLPLLLASVC